MLRKFLENALKMKQAFFCVDKFRPPPPPPLSQFLQLRNHTTALIIYISVIHRECLVLTNL